VTLKAVVGPQQQENVTITTVEGVLNRTQNQQRAKGNSINIFNSNSYNQLIS
jgi:C4-type Zn-finger protein